LVCGEETINTRYNDAYGDGQYKCDCRALLYAMKYNTLKFQNQYLAEMNQYNTQLKNLLSSNANTCLVSIPTHTSCRRHGWIRKCTTSEVKPNPRFAVVLEEPIDEEEDSLE
jgi:hypothetical protein